MTWADLEWDKYMDDGVNGWGYDFSGIGLPEPQPSTPPPQPPPMKSSATSLTYPAALGLILFIGGFIAITISIGVNGDNSSVTNSLCVGYLVVLGVMFLVAKAASSLPHQPSPEEQRWGEYHLAHDEWLQNERQRYLLRLTPDELTRFQESLAFQMKRQSDYAKRMGMAFAAYETGRANQRAELDARQREREASQKARHAQHTGQAAQQRAANEDKARMWLGRPIREWPGGLEDTAAYREQQYKDRQNRKR